MLLYHLRKGEIAAKMEKGKNVEIKMTEESLRMKLHRLKQEIRKMGERGIELELATATAQAKSAALDAELAAKMARYAVINEETVAMRKEHDAFNNDITMRLQKLHGKYPFFNQEATNNLKGLQIPFPAKAHKRKAAMGDNNEEIDLTDVVVAQPVLADQNELILQLMQQIAEMRVEMQRKQDLPSPIFVVNAQPDGRPPAQIPPPNVEQAQNPPSSPARYIHPVGPKPVDTSSKFYRPDQKCAYHSNSVGHDTEDCINLKHNIQDLNDQNVLVNATGDDLASQPPMPSVYKMIATIMLQSGFEPGFGLGKNFQGIVEPIQIPTKGAKFGLGYVPTDADEVEIKNKNIDQALAKPIPHLYQSFPIRENFNDGGLREGICGLLRRLMRSSMERLGHQASVMQNLMSNCRTGPPHRS
uniref:G-patch domain-containing protein n=1 Tax=Solanum tuberosum TaxID=4113 RepID=M1C2V0_SOLTU